jgi:predicted Zn-dependent protease
LTNQALTYFESKNYGQAIQLLNNALSNGETDAATHHLISQSYLAVGDVQKAYAHAKSAFDESDQEDEFKKYLAQCLRKKESIDSAVAQIAKGMHSTPEIEYAKSNTEQLLEHRAFEQAINQLRKLAEARQARTTNILWIGQCLKKLYFEPEAETLRPQFDKFLLDEIVFYYLKACKLHEQGYQIVREASKEVSANNG